MKGENMNNYFFSDQQQFKRQFGKIYKCGLMAKIGRKALLTTMFKKSYLVKRYVHNWNVMYKF